MDRLVARKVEKFTFIERNSQNIMLLFPIYFHAATLLSSIPQYSLKIKVLVIIPGFVVQNYIDFQCFLFHQAHKKNLAGNTKA